MSETKINASQTTITAEDIGASSAFDTMPTAAIGYLDKIVQYVGTTDATYTNGYFYKCVSDGQNPATYSWIAVQVQASSGGLPSQTGQSGKFLTTDGTDASWSDKPLVNKATGGNNEFIIGLRAITGNIVGQDAVFINTFFGGTAGTTYTNMDYVVSICQSYSYGGKPGNNSVGISGSSFGNYSVVIGRSATTEINTSYSVCIGYQATSNKSNTISIGPYARATATGAIQFNTGTNTATNSDANTFKVANANGNFEIMSADGTIPADRLASTTGLADGNYRLRLVMSNGTPTLSWVAE